jgi:hypothetical protein
MHKENRIRILNIFFTLLIFLTFALVLTTISYPLELEFREGTNWIHALALSKGINIFSTSNVAYINMNHGPIDSVLKSFVLRVAPHLDPRFVTRVFVIILPIEIFLLTSLKLNKTLKNIKFSNKSYIVLNKSYLYFLVSYIPLLAISSMVFVGRSDQTALCFAYLSSFLLLKCETKAKLTITTLFMLGLSLSMMVLTNWRFAILIPFILLLVIIKDQIIFIKESIFVLLGGIIPPLFILKNYYQWNFELYYKHYIGFFLGISGWQSSIAQYNLTQSDYKFLDYCLSFISTSYIHAASFIFNVACIALMLTLILLWRKKILNNKQKLSVFAQLFLCFLCNTSYFLNYSGGSLNYFFPLLVFMWALMMANENELDQIFKSLTPQAKFYITACFLIACSITLTLRYKFLFENYEFATRFKDQISLLEKNEHIYSESVFFQNLNDIPKIDMGDTASAVEKSGYYGKEFSEIFNANLSELKNHPPTYILSGRVSSPELKKLIIENYVQQSCAPPKMEPCLYKLKNKD